jgi:hypothetical protein
VATVAAHDEYTIPEDRDMVSVGQEFCAMHEDKVALAVAFLANAKPIKMSYNRTRTKMVLGLVHGARKVTVQVPIVDKHPSSDFFEAGEWMDSLLLAVLRSFGLKRNWEKFKSMRPLWVNHFVLTEEIWRRGGKKGFNLIDKQIHNLLKSGKPQKDRDAWKIQAELNRALAFLRRARKFGATPRQMRKLTSIILTEEIVMEIQGV